MVWYAPQLCCGGRRSCATSVRPGNPFGTQTTRPKPSPFALSSLFRILSPTIPVHRRHSPVSPIISVHTQKHGGGGVPPAKCVLPQTLCFLPLCYLYGQLYDLLYCRRADIFPWRPNNREGNSGKVGMTRNGKRGVPT